MYMNQSQLNIFKNVKTLNFLIIFNVKYVMYVCNLKCMYQQFLQLKVLRY